MNPAAPPNTRAQALLRIVAEAWAAGEPDSDWPARVNLSRFHFQRMFMRYLGETPGELRRRLLLERAAYELCTTSQSVTNIAFDAGYDSLEGFSRAFRRAYGVSPSHFRRIPLPRVHLPAASKVHYDPKTRGLRAAKLKGDDDMDLTDRLIDHDAWLTRRLLECAKTLSDKQLDAQLDSPTDIVPFECPPELTLREALHRMVFTKEVWVAAVRKRSLDFAKSDKSVAGMLKRLDRAFIEFAELVRQIRDEGRWDEEFEDALCEPAEKFTFGGMIAHVITFAAFRRSIAIKMLNRLGVNDVGYGDPIEWERSLVEQV